MHAENNKTDTAIARPENFAIYFIRNGYKVCLNAAKIEDFSLLSKFKTRKVKKEEQE